MHAARTYPIGAIGLALLFLRCTDAPLPERCFEVTATAYNSLPYQTRPGTSGNITAWGDTLHDSIPSIAISRDLLDSGLVYGSLVRIMGYEQLFVVNDKMNRRYKRRIDLHMGKDVRKAKEFGKKKLVICYLDSTAAILD